MFGRWAGSGAVPSTRVGASIHCADLDQCLVGGATAVRGDPARARRHADLVGGAVVADHGAHRVGSVPVPVGRELRDAGDVEPVVVVVEAARCGVVAAVGVHQGRVVELHAGVDAGHDDAVAAHAVLRQTWSALTSPTPHSTTDSAWAPSRLPVASPLDRLGRVVLDRGEDPLDRRVASQLLSQEVVAGLDVDRVADPVGRNVTPSALRSRRASACDRCAVLRSPSTTSGRGGPSCASSRPGRCRLPRRSQPRSPPSPAPSSTARGPEPPSFRYHRGREPAPVSRAATTPVGSTPSTGRQPGRGPGQAMRNGASVDKLARGQDLQDRERGAPSARVAITIAANRVARKVNNGV